MTQLTPEQQLQAVYDMLKKQESRAHWAQFFRFVKISLILALAYFVFRYPTEIINPLMDRFRPIILTQVQSLLESQKDFLDKQMKEMTSQMGPLQTQVQSLATQTGTALQSSESGGLTPEQIQRILEMRRQLQQSSTSGSLDALPPSP